MNNLTVQNINGSLYVNSREVALMVDKRHDHLMRDIKKYKEILDNANIEMSPNVGSANFFVSATYRDANNQDRPCFLLTKKGCDMVANKMSGTKGVLFTAAYVTKFEEMEKELRQPKLSGEQLKAQLLLNIYNGGQEGILASKQLTDLEVEERTKELTDQKNQIQGVLDVIVEKNTTIDRFNKIMEKCVREISKKTRSHQQDISNEFYRFVYSKLSIDVSKRQTNAINKSATDRMAIGKKPYSTSTIKQKFTKVSMFRQEEYDKVLQCMKSFAVKYNVDYDNILTL